MIKIEKNIPIPPVTPGRNPELAKTLGSMEIGDSFAYNTKFKPQVARFAAKTSRKFTVRRIEGGWRVWRIE